MQNIRANGRAGLHSPAPVIGGVVGRKKHIYDIFGDGVNRASRMKACRCPCVLMCRKRRATSLAMRLSLRPGGCGRQGHWVHFNVLHPELHRSRPPRCRPTQSVDLLGHDALRVVSGNRPART